MMISFLNMSHFWQSDVQLQKSLSTVISALHLDGVCTCYCDMDYFCHLMILRYHKLASGFWSQSSCILHQCIYHLFDLGHLILPLHPQFPHSSGGTNAHVTVLVQLELNCLFHGQNITDFITGDCHCGSSGGSSSCLFFCCAPRFVYYLCC